MKRIPEPVTILIPAFNEDQAIAKVIADLRATMDGSGRAYEILVVDDGSADSTAERAVQAGARVLRHLENRGYGSSLKAGIVAARYDTITITDADGTYPSASIPPLLAALDTCDMVVGARTGTTVRIPLVRRPAKWVLGWLANRIAGRRIPDLNSGLRAFRRDTVAQYFSVLSDKFSFTTTVTLALLADEYLLTYIPIDYYARIGKSKIAPRHFFDFCVLVLRMAMLFRPLRVFLPLATAFGLAGLLKLSFDVTTFVFVGARGGLESLYQPVVSTSALLLLTVALQVLVLGMVADGVLRRIAQLGRPLVPSRAVVVVDASVAAPDERFPARAL